MGSAQIYYKKQCRADAHLLRVSAQVQAIKGTGKALKLGLREPQGTGPKGRHMDLGDERVINPFGASCPGELQGNTSLAGLEVPHTLEDLGRLILGPKVDFGMNLMAPKLGGSGLT